VCCWKYKIATSFTAWFEKTTLKQGVLTSLPNKAEWLKPPVKDVKTPFDDYQFVDHAVNDVAINNTLLGRYHKFH
jgi:hypothetical protein